MGGDVIAAVSTPRGRGGVAMIRISGDGAIECASRMFVPAGSTPLTATRHATARYGRIIMPHGGEVIDDGVCVIYRAPHSFTGEDTSEITCHGGVLVTARVLEAAFAAGARPAEAGEFTRRAFLSGKITLSQAEATGRLIEAKTDSQLKLSSSTARGALSAEVSDIYSSLRSLVARTYVTIDYPEEDLADITPDELRAGAVAAAERLRRLCASYKTGRAVTDGVETVICGRPNAGKSTLFNLFAGEGSAIVTDIAGTTRDTLRADVAAGRVLLHLYDTAGLRDDGVEDPIERIGVSRAREKISTAELIIAVYDATEKPGDGDSELLNVSAPAKIAVINKADVASDENISAYKALAKAADTPAIVMSASKGDGFDELVAEIERIFTDTEIDLTSDAVLATARQFHEAKGALDRVMGAIAAIDNGLPTDIAAGELEGALAHLASLDGREVTEEIVNEIFSKFCVGK